MSNYYKEPKRRRPAGYGVHGGYGSYGYSPRANSSKKLSENAARQYVDGQPAPRDLALGFVSEGVLLNLKDPPAMDPAAAAAMRDPHLRAQQLCELAKNSKLPPVLEVKDQQLQQEDQSPRRFQVVPESLMKNLFGVSVDPLATARVPSHKDVLARAQRIWMRQHPNAVPPQEAELAGKGYVAKAQGELIGRENFKVQQLNNAMAVLRNQIHAYGYTLIAAQ
jgi:hypothetical protein